MTRKSKRLLSELSIVKMKNFDLYRRLRFIIGLFLLVVCVVAEAEVAVDSSAKITAGSQENAAAKSDKVPGVVEGHARIGGARTLHAEQWELVQSGENVLAVPVLNSVVNDWLQDRTRIIEIQYPGGEEGEFWVQQLSDWLVSLGVPSANMTTVPGSGADDVIRFNLINTF
jgi:hypothetical protein